MIEKLTECDMFNVNRGGLCCDHLEYGECEYSLQQEKNRKLNKANVIIKGIDKYKDKWAIGIKKLDTMNATIILNNNEEVRVYGLFALKLEIV